MKFFCLLFLFLSFSIIGTAQQLEGHINLHTFADNREYAKSDRFSQTIFGVRFSPEVGILIDSTHRFRIGVNAFHEFGSPEFAREVKPVVYYQYQKQRWDLLMGVFPRQSLLNDYPRVIFNDTLNYFRPNVEGMLLRFHTGKKSHQTIWIDWTSRQTELDRETFLFGISGTTRSGLFFLSHYAMMFHNAGPAISIPGDHIQDNGAATLKLGVDLSELTVFDSLTFNTGGIVSFERTRTIGDWQTPTGLLLEMHAGYKRFALTNSFYVGEGHNLVYGDPFYSAKQYNRTDLSYTPIRYKNIEGNFILSYHFLEGVIDNQQAFSLRYNIGGKKSIKNRINGN